MLEINTQNATKVTLNGHFYAANHTMLLTMVDRKICKTTSEAKSTMRCFICEATSKHFNNSDITNEIGEVVTKV